MTTDIHPIEGAPDLEYEIRIEAPRDLVWSFWVEPDRLVRWMGSRATLETHPGGAFRLEYRSGDVVAGSYVEVEPPRRLVVTWGWEEEGSAVPAGASTIEVGLESLEGGAATLLRLRHLGLPEESRGSHDEGWRYFLGRLVEASAGREVATT